MKCIVSIKAVLCLTILISCGKSKDPCTVTDSDNGATIRCPDGTEEEIFDGTEKSADATPILSGPAGETGAKGEKGDKGDKGEIGPKGEAGPKGDNALDPNSFVYDANGTKIGRFLGSAGLRSYYAKLLDGVFVLLGTGGDVQPTSVLRCYYTSSNCTGTCYGLVNSSQEVNDYVTVNGRDIGGAGVDIRAMKIQTKAVQTPISFVSHYQGSSCIVEGANPILTNSYFSLSAYTPTPSFFVAPLDIRVE